MLYVPSIGNSRVENSTLDGTTYLNGTPMTANVTTHTKGAYSTVFAATSYTSYGITIGIANIGLNASNNNRSLIDVAIGPEGSEVDVIPNLLGGQTGSVVSTSSQPQWYHFPIIIPAGVRVSARMQSVVSNKAGGVIVRLHQHSVPGKWYGTRVTAYGVNTATSTGTAHTGGTNTYATTTQLTASTTYPIKYMQLGHDLATDTTGTTMRRLVRIAAGSSTNYVASDLPVRESTTLEHVDYTLCNMILSHMGFNIPAGSYLGVGAMQNSTLEARGYAIYGVD